MCSKIRNNVYLLGNECSQITGGKLPSIKQALLVFFYNLRVVKLNIRESARLAVREIVIFWEKARIPVQDTQHCISKLEKLYHEWRTVQKNSTKRTECQIKKEVVFSSKSDDLFDIAHVNALNMLGIQEDRDFLLLQREKGRKGYMMGVDTKLVKAEKRKADRLKSLNEASKRSKIEAEKLDTKIELVSFSSEEEYEVDYTSESDTEIPSTSTRISVKRDCGRVYTNSKILIANGKKAFVGTAPWNVGIYQLNKKNINYDLICGGSIIAPNLIISAAHCFWHRELLSKKNISIDNNSYKVAVGKYNRDFTVVDNDFTQIINVEMIYLNEDYYGPNSFHAHDIAVLVLSNRISFSNVVSPICIDWNNKFNVSNGVEGKIVGWGKTEKGILSPILLETYLPYIDHNFCRDIYKNGFQIFVTVDKFCAGSESVLGRDLGEGDSGSGLTFLHSASYYLTGVLSLKEASSNNSIAVFTDIKYHIQWIRRMYNKHN